MNTILKTPHSEIHTHEQIQKKKKSFCISLTLVNISSQMPEPISSPI